jgi:hypothetical protein
LGRESLGRSGRTRGIAAAAPCQYFYCCLGDVGSLSAHSRATISVHLHILIDERTTLHSTLIPNLSEAGRTENMSATYERALRVGTLLTTALATPLLIALTVISIEYGNWWYRRNVTAFCFGYFPLAMTAVASAVSIRHHRKHNRVPGPRLAILDGVASLTYLGVLIPVWAVEVRELEQPGFGLLTGYCTTPMIVNM